MSSKPESFTQVVRIANTDISGADTVVYGLARIKGIGYTTALAVARKLGIDPNARMGYLPPEVLSKLESAVLDLTKLGLPVWLYNRRKDYETGEDRHLVGAELVFAARRDVEKEIKIGSWRGIRHKLGYKVRGQRTRTTGRTGMTIGVRKAVAQPAAGGGKEKEGGGNG